MNKDNTAVAFLSGIIAIVAVISIVFVPRFLANQMHSTNTNAQRQYEKLLYRDDGAHAPSSEYVQKKSHNKTKLNDKVSAQAYDYKQSHPEAKFVKLDFSTGNKAKESYHERLLDKPDTESVDQVFYVDRDGKVASGDKYDYHEALKSKNVVYVFVK